MISILVPSRKRTSLLLRSLKTLTDLADDPERIELLVAADPDDEETQGFAPDLPSQVKIWVTPKRFGYVGLHDYYNGLAERAIGEWLFIWNDDALMETKGWDSIIHAQPNTNVLWMSHNDHVWANIWPIVPRSWFTVLGHLGLLPPVDTWMQDIAEILDREVKIPVSGIHDTPHLTGRASDEGYEEKLSFYDAFVAVRYQREEDAEKIRNYSG